MIPGASTVEAESSVTVACGSQDGPGIGCSTIGRYILNLRCGLM